MNVELRWAVEMVICQLEWMGEHLWIAAHGVEFKVVAANKLPVVLVRGDAHPVTILLRQGRTISTNKGNVYQL